MATRILSRSFHTSKQTISSMFSRSYTAISLSTLSLSTSSSSPLLRLRPLVAVAANFSQLSRSATIRGFATRQTTSSLNDSSPNWSNRPPKETILLDGCDFEHWLVVMEKPEGDPTRDEIIDSYINTLAQVVGSAEEARMKIYSVSTRHYFAFGALVSEELSYKLKELPKVRWVLPDSYLDVKNKDYGGEPFINGQAVPYDPKYHEEWVRNNARANERNRRNDRPRNFDRSRNFERRRENMQQNRMGNPGMQNSGPNMAGAPPNNMGGAPNMGGPPPSNAGVPNTGGPGGPPPNFRGGPLPNMGGVPPSNIGGPPPNMGGMPPINSPNFQQRVGPNSGGMPYQGGPGPNYQNQGAGPGPNYQNQGAGPGPNYQNQGAGPGSNYQNQGAGPGSNYQNPQGGYQSGPGPNYQNQGGYAPNVTGGNPYQTQDMPGRDMPPPPNYQ